MAKKASEPPKLTLVTSNSTAASPGRKPGADLWRAVNAEYDVSDAGGVELLMQACEASDRLAQIKTQVARDGLTIKTKSGLREHPLLKAELGLRSFITRTLVRLGINTEAVQSVGRPGRKGLDYRAFEGDE
jgi:hypothetical protein